MNSVTRYIYLICILSILTIGCSTNRKEIQPMQLAGFKKGISTNENVIAVLGAPDQTTLARNGTKTIVYSTIKFKLKGTNSKLLALMADDPDVTITQTSFKFDQNGKLISFESREATRDGQGFFSSKCPEIRTLEQDMKCKGL
jgi:hypothetical protein